ncbi:hypothetical protein [Yoonia sp.]|uniref:hypothetical protein n=1 Tax=Yoonia sp. TaxID=2212373 RepID=UPI002E013410|nr:hypothetical protein [Yoonia sp.]
MHSTKCWTRPQIALAAVMTFLTACEKAGSDTPYSACLPVVEYSRAEQTRVAEELAALPEGALIVEWLADYAVLREQARTCGP